MQLIGSRLIRAESGEVIAAHARTIEWIGPRLFIPSTLLVLAFGIALVAVSDVWTIGQLWIILALVGIAITAITGAVFFGPQAKRIGEATVGRGGQRAGPERDPPAGRGVPLRSCSPDPDRRRHGPEARGLTL
jgi:hypothetical protein